MLKKIGDSYLEPNKKFPELRQMSDSGLIDLLAISAKPVERNFGFVIPPSIANHDP